MLYRVHLEEGFPLRNPPGNINPKYISGENFVEPKYFSCASIAYVDVNLNTIRGPGWLNELGS